MLIKKNNNNNYKSTTFDIYYKTRFIKLSTTYNCKAFSYN